VDFEEREDTRGFTQISTEDLRQLAAALNNGTVKTPLQPATLSHAHLGHLAPGLGPFMGLDRAPLLGLIRVALAERRRAQGRTVELVWSGPDAGPSYARYTRLVVPEMLDAAAERATIAGYSFDEAGGVFEHLHSAQARGVDVRLFLDIDQVWTRLRSHIFTHDKDRRPRLGPVDKARESGPSEFAAAVLELFRDVFWPFDSHLTIYFDPRTADKKSFASLHAKCVIVDCAQVLVTSANFTGRGNDRNIEVGVVIRDAAYAKALETQWNNLIQSGDVVKG
jgi:phosphatidylserine/phosphatidylglycerophosphate/cardiolipin synthase-like enzyme